MMKRLLKVFLILVMSFVLINVATVKADDSNDDVEFNDFVYVSTKKRENNKIKVQYQISFEASKSIVVEEISYEIRSQQGNIPILSKCVSTTQKYTFMVEDWQTGTLELVIKYTIANDGVPSFNDGKTYVKTMYLVDNAAWMEEIDWGKSIILGIFTMICVVVATSIIISSSKKELLIKEIEDEWEEES